MNKIKKLLVATMVFAFLLVPMLAMTASAKSAKLNSYDDGHVQMWSPASYAFLEIENAKKDAKYTVSLSKKGILQFEGYNKLPKGDGGLVFWMKKTGKVTVTVKETYKGKTKKIGSIKYTVKKDKNSFYNSAEEKTIAKYLNQKVHKGYDGVSLEVVQMMNVSNNEATFVLAHAPNDFELMAAKAGQIEFSIHDASGRAARYVGTLKAGSTVVRAIRKPTLYGEPLAVTAGKLYYATSFKRSEKGGSGYMLKAIAQ